MNDDLIVKNNTCGDNLQTDRVEEEEENDEESQITIVKEEMLDHTPMEVDDPQPSEERREEEIQRNREESGGSDVGPFEGFLPSNQEEEETADVVKYLTLREEVYLENWNKIQVPKTGESKQPVSRSSSKLSSSRRKRKIGAEDWDASSGTSTPTSLTSSQDRSDSPDSIRGTSIDVSNPLYHEPFKHGWRREVICRSKPLTDNQLLIDVFYWSPSGKKLRSSKGINLHLTENLTINNFTFYKGALGASPEHEIIRNVSGKRLANKRFTAPESENGNLTSPARKPSTDIKEPPARNSPKSKSTNRVNKSGVKRKKKESLNGVADAKSSNVVLYKIEPHPDAPNGPRRKFTPRSSVVQTWRPCGQPKEPLSWSHLDENKSSPSASISNENRLDPCTIRCTKAMGLIPTQQCRVCLCLYHPECCGLHDSVAMYKTIANYVCKNCQSKVLDTKKRNLVKHITPVGICDVNSPPILSPKPLMARATPILRPKPIAPQPQVSNCPQTLVTINNQRLIVVPKPKPQISTQTKIVVTPTPHCTLIKAPPLRGNKVLLLPYDGSAPSLSVGNLPRKCLVVNPSSTSTGQPDLPVGSVTPQLLSEEGSDAKKNPVIKDSGCSMKFCMQTMLHCYAGLLEVFTYLKVSELLVASRVCRMWRDIAGHKLLWQTVKMKNSKVSDWKGFAASIKRHGTRNLDLRKILMPVEQTAGFWNEFAKLLSECSALEKLDMCRCCVPELEQLASACKQLQIFNAQMIYTKDENCKPLNLDKFASMPKLHELRLKPMTYITLLGSIASFSPVKDTLSVFSITAAKSLDTVKLSAIADLVNLTVLEIGYCEDSFPLNVLPNLTKLRRLRLEKGTQLSPTNGLLQEVSCLPKLTTLELINFDIGPGFDTALSNCKNLKRLLLAPTYVTQSATTNNLVLSAVYELGSLTSLTWILTMELLKVTELYISQSGKDQKGSGEFIPVIKPLPTPKVRNNPVVQTDGVTRSNNISVLAIDDLYNMLSHTLPSTMIRLQRIPFHATWRQTIPD